jgi:acyl transferase domain-containing protein/3-hydroxymyristoyl/3-hydroxydecanoyl-(acyl carrier protein) dehydratase
LPRAIAIVSAGGILPGGNDLDGFWRLVVERRDALSEPPPGRWLLDPEAIRDPSEPKPDRVLCTRGGFVPDTTIPPRDGGFDAATLEQLDPSVILTLKAAREAWDAAQTGGLAGARVAVILGHIALPTESMSALSRAVIGREIEKQVTGRDPGETPVSPYARHAMGLPALAVAKDLGLSGRAFAIDAACSSSLFSLALACEELRARRADAVIAGGASRPDSLYTQMGFSQLRASSRKGFCTPFDERGDGLVVGEGAVCFVLKRLDDAVAVGDEILGVIRGYGLSNDVEGNLLAPSSEGQVRALRAAYEDAGWTPTAVDLIECHATGTPVGDGVEVTSLRELWAGAQSPVGRCVIGGAKSNVGHLLTGAGAVGVAKVLLAMRHGVLPPTAHFEKAPDRVPLEGTQFEVLREPEPWPRRGDSARRAGVSAFGFGGTNAHVLIEEWLGGEPEVEPEPVDAPVAVIGTATADPPTAVRAGRFRIPPTEIAEMLAQQALILDTADRALSKAGIEERSTDLRAGVFAGIHVDPDTTDYDLRWWALAHAESWGRADDAVALADAVHEPLTAHRVLGALGGVAGARVAREMRFGGVSMSIDSEGGNEPLAVDLARAALARGDIDIAVVAVADVDASRGTPPDWEPHRIRATATVLRRLSDAEANSEPVEAVLMPGAVSVDAPDLSGVVGLAGWGFARVRDPDTALPWVRRYDDGPRAVRITSRNLLGGRFAIGLQEPPRRELLTSVRRDDPAAFLVVGATDDVVRARLAELSEITGTARDAAREWARRAEPHVGDVRVALVARDTDDLRDRIGEARAMLDGAPPRRVENARVFVTREPLATTGELAFVFPGSGSHFMGMGEEFAEHFPDVITGGPHGPETFAEELRPDVFWTGETPLTDDDQRPHIQAQVALGTMLSGLLKSFGLKPSAYLGYSLGETAALYASGAWKARREMIDRVAASDLFTQQLCGPCDAAREVWGLDEGDDVDWLLGVLAAPANDVREALSGHPRAYLLIVNTDDECVIGGAREQVEAVVASLGRPFVPLSGVTTVHCDVLEPVADAYHALHVFDDAGPPPDGARVYSCAWGDAYDVTRTSGASSIVENARSGFDWPRAVRKAYDDGVRVFVEIGPGNSCTRMIRCILGDLPHRCVSLCVEGRDAYDSVLRVLAAASVEGFDVDLSRLDGDEPPAEDDRPVVATVTPGMKPFVVPPLPQREPPPAHEPAPAPVAVASPSGPDPVVAALEAASAARIAAHETFLRVSDNTNRLVADGIDLQQRIIASGCGDAPRRGDPRGRPPEVEFGSLMAMGPDGATAGHVDTGDPGPVAFTRDQCMEFATGTIAAVLGPRWAEVDSYPTRVRLPDEPYMFVDRILSIEGEPLSMTHGRIVTEHDVQVGQWYLDHGCIPTGLCIEAGQADLFLSAYLGADFQSKGLATYRLLDAAVTFHGPLPRGGDTIRFDIHIERFFRQGQTYLFRFRFDGSVGGRPLLSMRDGCAGFFTQEELDAGQGIVLTERDRAPQPGTLPAGWRPYVPVARTALDDAQCDALRAGDLAGAFGDAFAGLPLRNVATLPGDRMNLVHRVTDLDPEGGRYGIGLVRTEIDVHPDDWFLTCHFVDDMVMPGTLMYECSLHALRVLLMRYGLLGEEGEVAYEPIPGVASRLRCRGQILETTKISAYEVHLKEIGFGPEPYALADCLMYADGRRIVHMHDMTVRMTGTDRESIEALWSGRADAGPHRFQTRAGILALADGDPSDAFGPRLAPFDHDRFVARLPRPPYSFLDRVESVSHPPFQMVKGLTSVAAWDVPDAEACFSSESGGRHVPFAVLQEAALQACGWCSAYMGSALTSDVDLHYRNLGGKATLHRAIEPGRGALRTHVECTDVSASAGMILQHFAFSVRDEQGGVIYDGTTYFGFFSADALAKQVGVTGAALTGGDGETFPMPDAPAFPRDRWRMLRDVEAFDPQAGAHGLGYIRAGIDVDPEAWFFRAHFKGDPVWPGSLGLESILQALQVAAASAFGLPEGDVFVCTAPGAPHEWQYRGQVLPTAQRVTVEAHVTSVDREARVLVADAQLAADGKVIYATQGFSVQVVS